MNIFKQGEVLNYNKEILQETCTIFLGNHTIDGANRPVFLSKDGIITDGYAIISLNAKGLKEENETVSIIDPGSGVQGGYVYSFKMANTRGEDTTEYEVAVEQLKKDGTYDALEGEPRTNTFGFFGGKTISKHKNLKKKMRKTRRL